MQKALPTSFSVLILDSRFWEGNTYLGGKFDAFLKCFLYFGCFSGGGGGFGIRGGDPPGDSWK